MILRLQVVVEGGFHRFFHYLKQINQDQSYHILWKFETSSFLIIRKTVEEGRAGRAEGYNIYQMQRKKPEKLNFAVAVNNSDYFEGVGQQPPSSHPTNLNESLFFKYASSIIQVVSEDRLDSSTSVSGPHAHQAIFEISEVKEFEEGGWVREAPAAQEQNNYNNLAAKMKKKGISRKILAYNFSSISLLCQKINLVVQKQLKSSLIMLRTFPGSSDYLKTKKEIKRASFHSGYTASTSNEERPYKRNSKKLTEERRREMHEEGANSINGWLKFKTLMMVSQAFSSIKDFAISRANMGISQASTIKQQPLQKFYLTEYQHDNSISIARELPHNISESLVYTADQNFEFTQKEVTLTTPEKFYSEDRLSTPPMPPQTRRVNSNQSNQESFVESYKIKQPMPKPPIKEKIIVTTSRPIQMIGGEHRRYLNIRTNIYELPMLSEHELKPDRQKIFKDPNNLGDHFTRNEPQTCDNIEATLKQINETCNLFNHKINIPSYFHQRESDFNKINEKRPLASNRATANKKNQLQTKKVESRQTTQLIKEQKRTDTHKVQNIYFLNQNTFSNPSKANPTALRQKQSFEQIKSVQSILSPLKSERKNDKPPIRMQESVVNEYMVDLRIKEALSPPSSKLQPHPYLSELTDRKDQRLKSRSKINIMMQSPRRENPKPNVYPPIEPLKLDNRPSLKSNEDKNNGTLYGYTHQKPNSPRPMQNEQKPPQSPRMIPPPTPNPHNIYQINQGVPFTRQAAPQTIMNHVKSNEQFKTQKQIRIEPMHQSPGKVVNPNYLITSQQKRMGGAPSYFRQEDRKSFYSPQMTKDNYLQTPQRPIQPFIEPQKVQNPSSIRRMHSDEYFNKDTNPNPQLRAINFNNNYYTNGPQTARNPPIISQPSRNVFQQEEPIRRQGYMDRPPSSRQSCERAALFSNYSPLDSQLQLQHQRSNNFSKNSSELSRPKSMNEKIFITLRKEK